MSQPRMPLPAHFRFRRLGPADTLPYAEHLLRLPGEDRRLRFYGDPGKAWLRDHARAALGEPHAFAHGAWEGGHLRAVALCPTVLGDAAELTLSVEAAWCRRGLARALLARLLRDAARQGCARALLPLEPAAPGLREFALSCGAREASEGAAAEFRLPPA